MAAVAVDICGGVGAVQGVSNRIDLEGTVCREAVYRAAEDGGLQIAACMFPFIKKKLGLSRCGFPDC